MASYIHKIKNKKIWCLLIIFAFALALRLHHLDYESLWMDELRQVSYYPHSFLQIIDDAASQSQPPLDYWIGRVFDFMAPTDFMVRLPSALFGTGSVVVLVTLIAPLTSWWVAMSFGVVASLLPFNLYYSQEARPYAIAIFLGLCLLWALNKLLTAGTDKIHLRAFVLLFCAATFLYTRSLFPLVLIVGLLFILAIWFLLLVIKGGATLTTEKKRIFIATVALLSAVGVYLPSLKFILTKSARYVSDASLGLNLSHLTRTGVNFDLSPLWQAYVVQSEPLTYPLLFLIGVCPFTIWPIRSNSKVMLGTIIAVLLPLVGLMNLFIFQTKSSLPFRPAYAGYILPLALMLGALGAQGLWDIISKAKISRMLRVTMVALSSILLLQVAHAALEYKSMPIKSDWRAVSTFLERKYNQRHLIIFDSLSPYGAWEPTFYGFPRYYRGNSPLVSMAALPIVAGKVRDMQCKPVLVLFQWREYYLTPQSRYPIMSVPNPYMKEINYQKLCGNPLLKCDTFNGFWVIHLKEDSHNPAQETYTLIEWAISNLPQGTWTIELHLAAAGLAKVIGQSRWRYHLMQAEALAGNRGLPRVKKIANHIRNGIDQSDNSERGSLPSQFK